MGTRPSPGRGPVAEDVPSGRTGPDFEVVDNSIARGVWGKGWMSLRKVKLTKTHTVSQRLENFEEERWRLEVGG